MLSALELNGFKSFADRTRFEFGAGITVVVGPNGSGKSNVVDAIKWVLGSQSVKALRGKESTDVIFSGTRGRRQANAAEVSLIFDNSAGLLDHDAAEVQITRRVYRSGETEYLLNRQPCRLRDLRDLLSGVGMATGAYSIIEQGKVDAVLQASPKERRLIFEEAAGVSRFRVKREESLRRMERVDQNLLRLSDIVQELHGRLKSVRSQAGRAQRYSELTSRLTQLRTHVGRLDWRRLSGQIAELQTQRAEQDSAAAKLEAELAQCERAVADADARGEQWRQQVRQLSAREADVRERLAQCESTRGSHLARIDELVQEVDRLGRQVTALASRAGDSQQLVQETAAESAHTQAQLAALQNQLAATQQQLAAAEQRLVQYRTATSASRSRLEQVQREAAQLDADGRSAEARRAALEAAIDRCREECGPLGPQRDRLAGQSQRAVAELETRTTDLAAAARSLHSVQAALADHRTEHAAAQRRMADSHNRLSGTRERVAVLEELERQLDGLTSGAKEVLRQAREQPNGPLSCVQGVVADLVSVDADSAPLVEVVLGERANALVVSDAKSLAPVLVDESRDWPGRTSFLRLDVPHPASAVDRIDLSNEPGVMGRADQFVDAPPELAGMVRRLLGRHWFVNTLATALRLSSGMGRGLNFVTAAGELVLADGTLTVGPRQAASGLLSRRSELRALREQIEEIRRDSAEAEAACDRLQRLCGEEETLVKQLAAQHAEALHRHGDARLAAGSLADKLTQLDGRLAALTTEADAAQQQIADSDSERSQAILQAEQLRNEAQQLHAELLDAAAQETSLQAERDQCHHAAAEVRVQLARCEQRHEGLTRQRLQLERDHAERDRTLEETRLRSEQCQVQQTRLAAAAEELATEAAQLAAERIAAAEQLVQGEADGEVHRRERTAATTTAEGVRQRLFAAQRKLQSLALDVQKVEQHRTTLAERLREDLQVDIALLEVTRNSYPDSPETPQQPEPPASVSSTSVPEGRTAIDAEIREIREQLAAAGPVNLEAVAELESLDKRHGELLRRYEDLQTARQRLEQIISQINGESRQLFTDAVDEVRGHFQEIFRRLFAGGEADIVLEPDDSGDVLECGVSIVARPPGKQPRSISLLSGGERTLTCVALLLAIFRSRPSPFCVLDEVDAALDEANIERFVEVLKQFMTNTQFIVITHSKRTMACGDVLYGVTMQESGVSKRLSVRFEDVSEDGKISPAAISRDEIPPAMAA